MCSFSSDLHIRFYDDINRLIQYLAELLCANAFMENQEEGYEFTIIADGQLVYTESDNVFNCYEVSTIDGDYIKLEVFGKAYKMRDELIAAQKAAIEAAGKERKERLKRLDEAREIAEFERLKKKFENKS
jgi:hypothetical protein